MQGWPAVGQQSVSIAAHAASVRVDIEKLRDCLQKGASSIPKDVFEYFSSSVDVLVDKILDMPDYSAIEKSIKRIEDTTSRLNSQHSSSTPHIPDAPGPTIEPTVTVQALLHDIKDDLRRNRKSSKLALRPRHLTERDENNSLYSPLNRALRQIRVIKIDLQPHPLFDISCELLVVSLDSQLEYKALSYVWGDARDTHPILLNGHRFDVTQNLKRAMLRLRDGGIVSPIWIDAISINQADTEERNQQVQMMGQIYESTSEVMVYLGEHAQSRWRFDLSEPHHTSRETSRTLCTWTGDDADISLVETILAYAQDYADRFPELPEHPEFEPLSLLMCLIRLLAGDVHLSDIPLLQNLNTLKECMTALNFLLVQPWWTRIWVVQEIILSPVVTAIYGRYMAPLHMFVNAAEQLKVHLTSCCKSVLNLQPSQQSTLAAFAQIMSTIGHSWSLRQSGSAVNLPTLLQLYHTRDAKDPRDKIYGLLGLVQDWGAASPIEPEYRIRTKKLFEIVALNWIRVTGSLSFLPFGTALPALAAHQDETLDAVVRRLKSERSLPSRVQITNSSWAPDWTLTSEPRTMKMIKDRTSRYPLFNAANGCPAFPNPEDRIFLQSQVLTPAAVLGVAVYRAGKIGLRRGREAKIPPIVQQPELLDILTRVQRHEWQGQYLPLSERNVPYDETPSCDRYGALCRALIADCWVDDQNTSYQSPTEQNFRRASENDVHSVKIWREWRERRKTSNHNTNITPERGEFTHNRVYRRTFEADQSLRSATHLRCLISTDTGFLGLGPEGTREDDTVMIFMGAKVPYVVRKLGNSEFADAKDRSIWAIIGECYLVGAMDGEIVRHNQMMGMESEVIYVI